MPPVKFFVLCALTIAAYLVAEVWLSGIYCPGPLGIIMVIAAGVITPALLAHMLLYGWLHRQPDDGETRRTPIDDRPDL